MIYSTNSVERWPDSYEDICKDVMTNNDHSICDGAETLLKENEIVARYPGWNFHGYVWWDRNVQRFKCCVYQFHHPVGTIIAETLQEVMDLCCDKYGAE